MHHIAEPLSCQGFYVTRLAARRVIRAAIIVALTFASLALGIGVLLLGIFDFLGVVTWGIR